MAITIDDFRKIWASTSPLTPYFFSESNYKEGWNFVGSTPPSRQMWDFLQKQNDEKSQYLLNNFDNYLPLSGGTMTGTITLADGGNPLSTNGGTMTGAIIGNPLTLTADDGNGNIVDLVLNPNGSATWDNKEIVRIAQEGKVTGQSNHGIRFTNGRQICWGIVALSTNTTSYVTFIYPFSDYPAITGSVDRTTTWRVFGSSQLTEFSVSWSDSVNNGYFKWIAMGYWQ